MNFEEYFVFHEGKKSADDETNSIYIFSDEKDYIDWGINKYNVNMSKLSLFEDEIHEYLEMFPEILEIEYPNELPQHFIKYQDEVYNKYFLQSDNGLNLEDRGTALIHKECNGYSTAFVHITMPVMWPGWNNQTSAAMGLYILGMWNIYDRTFYRNRIITHVSVGYLDCWVPFGYDDRMSSVILL